MSSIAAVVVLIAACCWSKLSPLYRKNFLRFFCCCFRKISFELTIQTGYDWSWTINRCTAVISKGNQTKIFEKLLFRLQWRRKRATNDTGRGHVTWFHFKKYKNTNFSVIQIQIWLTNAFQKTAFAIHFDCHIQLSFCPEPEFQSPDTFIDYEFLPHIICDIWTYVLNSSKFNSHK